MKILQDLNFEFAVVLHIFIVEIFQKLEYTGQELIKLALFEAVDSSKLISRKISLVEKSLISTIQNLPSEMQHNYHHLFRENVTLEFYRHKKLTDTVTFSENNH